MTIPITEAARADEVLTDSPLAARRMAFVVFVAVGELLRSNAHRS